MTLSLKVLFAAGLIGAAPLASAFAADTYALDPAHTQTIFTIDHPGFSTITGAVQAFRIRHESLRPLCRRRCPRDDQFRGHQAIGS